MTDDLVGDVIQLVHSRGQRYGDSLTVAARIWTAGLGDRLNGELSARDVADMMALLKIAREVAGGHVKEGDDTIKDLIGYLFLALQTQEISKE